MTAEQYRAALEALGLTQEAAARFLRIHESASRKMARGGLKPLWATAALLRVMLAKGITVEEVEHIMHLAGEDRDGKE